MSMREYWSEEQQSAEREFDLTTMKNKAWGWILFFIFTAFGLLWYGTTQAQTTCPTSPAPCAWNEDCLTWTRPTTYSDGSALTATDIGTYQVEVAPVGSTTWTALSTVTAPTQGYKRTGLRHGDSSQYRVWVTMKSGVRSAVPSNVCPLTTTEPPPNPPVLSVNDALAYEIYTTATGVLTARAVGAVDLGTQCLEETQVVGSVTYNRVASAAVDRDVRLNQQNWRKNADLKLWATCI